MSVASERSFNTVATNPNSVSSLEEEILDKAQHEIVKQNSETKLLKRLGIFDLICEESDDEEEILAEPEQAPVVAESDNRSNLVKSTSL